MMRTCQQTGVEFEITKWEEDFIKRASPVFDGKRYEFPLPNLCPEERARKRTAQRNEQNFFKVKSAMSKKPLVSIYSGDEYKVYSHDEWWNGDWDPMDAARDFDFSRPFFEQFHELDLEIPRSALIQVNNVNCPYTTGTGYCKNCHLINCSENCEDCMYGKLLQGCKDCMDVAYGYDSELLYECFNVENCYNSIHLSYSQNCSDCLFSENLRGCRNCFLCTNLSNKEYYFMNKKVDKELYQWMVQDCLGSHTQVLKAKKLLQEMRLERIYKYSNIINCEGCSGDFLTNCRNCLDCYDMNDCEDCMYVQVGVDAKDLLDCSNMYLKPEMNYQVLGTIGTTNVHFSVFVFHSSEVLYSQFCYNSRDLFGCCGLRNRQYCIFNKQYTKEEYNELVPKIIEHMMKSDEWGEFFPSESSAFAYNDSVAHQYYPLRREEVEARGLRWRRIDAGFKVDNDIVIPDNITDVDDGILDMVLQCEKTGRGFKILERELAFLRKMKMPIPRLCHEARHEERMALRNPMRLYDRQCASTGERLKSPFPLESSCVIYGEQAYLEKVF